MLERCRKEHLDTFGKMGEASLQSRLIACFSFELAKLFRTHLPAQ